MTRREIMALARAIQAELMTNGEKEQAVRLQLRGPDEKDLGGYCRDRVFEIIRNHLRSSLEG